MAHSARTDCPELPDFSLLKRLARDQLIYLLEQVRTTPVWSSPSRRAHTSNNGWCARNEKSSFVVEQLFNM